MVSYNREIKALGAEKWVAIATGQKMFKNVFRQNLPRNILGKVTFHEIAITNVTDVKKNIIPLSSPWYE